MTTTLDEGELQRQFDEVIARNDRIEPRDWMPEGYRKTLVRQVAQHAHSEIIGMQPEGNWITRAPSLRRKAILLAKVQDEAGHGLYLYSATETLGVSRGGADRDADRGPAEVLLDLQLPDAVVRRRRDHRLARRRRRDLQPGAAVPDVVRALRPGDDPDLQGGVVPPAAGLRAADDDDARHRRAAGDGPGVGRPVLVAGADDVRPARRGLPQHRAVDGVGHQAQHQRRPAPADRRHDGAAGQGARRDLARPDARRGTRSAGHYDFAQPDWDEFMQVVKGNGPCNRQRIAHRRRAHEDGAWVREAATAFAAKQEVPA